MSRAGSRGRVAALVITAAVATAGTACSGSPTATGPGSAPPAAAAEPVAVERRDLTSVLTIDATIVATPAFRARAPHAGRLTRGTVRPGAAVRAGAVIGTVAGRKVVVPTAGTFEAWIVGDGATVSAGVPVARLTSGGFAVRGAVPAALAYRVYAGPLGARAQVVGGPGPFDCPLLDTGAGAGEGDRTLAFTCAVPGELAVLDGLGAVLALTTAARRGVLALPVEAVAGDSTRGEVTVLDEPGSPRTAVVELGASDGSYVEIVAGLREGQRVARTAPDLRPGRGQ